MSLPPKALFDFLRSVKAPPRGALLFNDFRVRIEQGE